MTVGIAATGPRAGAGVLAGLRMVEAIGSGSIGGFVTFAALAPNGGLLRFETQTGGADNLFAHGVPDAVLSAPQAALISSGPNRPTPLAQFVAAAPGVGLVTGHRFPQTLSPNGQALNAMVLEAMARGMDPQDAVSHVIALFPDYDAGFLAASVSGDIGMGNMPSVLARSDQGGAQRSVDGTSAHAAMLHNAIFPNRGLATAAVDVVLDAMLYTDTPAHRISIEAGIAITQGATAEVHVDHDMQAQRVLHPGSLRNAGSRTFGLGDKVRVLCDGQPLGWLGYEPFMTLQDGRILDMDGARALTLPVVERRRFEP